MSFLRPDRPEGRTPTGLKKVPGDVYLTILMVTAIVVAALSAIGYFNYVGQVQNLTEENKVLQDNIVQLNRTILSLHESTAQQMAQIRTLVDEIGQQEAQTDALETQLVALQEVNQALANESDRLKEQNAGYLLRMEDLEEQIEDLTKEVEHLKEQLERLTWEQIEKRSGRGDREIEVGWTNKNYTAFRILWKFTPANPKMESNISIQLSLWRGETQDWGILRLKTVTTLAGDESVEGILGVGGSYSTIPQWAVPLPESGVILISIDVGYPEDGWSYTLEGK